ncbi:N-acetyltransferase [Actinocatenispora thailandica]|uniref:N-acetyltransferase n=1 Tax=Actinocatenispora thailandica TaxID=227318 RepID=A0A7R7DL07_9ACTN|nr:GNAT family N-acetyltransferase [Actinocatenispora thailandica]BCJ33684.1 N-acetyltransferase [Actinocatenispora thailandica]
MAANDPELAVRGAVSDAELRTLFSAAWGDDSGTCWAPILARSLSWVTARRGETLVGFVNVATDGGRHAFLLDTTVHPDEQHRGLGTRLVRAAADQARTGGAEWLHVDYEPHLTGFYAGCGFRPTTAGLLRVAPSPGSAR